MISNNIDAILADFEASLHLLKEHPDKKLILDLTKCCERNVSVSPHLADIIIARIIDPATNISWKLPIFYLLDSIMKHVGGPFPMLFSKHLAAVFQRTFDEVIVYKCQMFLAIHRILNNLILFFFICLVAHERKGEVGFSSQHLGRASDAFR